MIYILQFYKYCFCIFLCMMLSCNPIGIIDGNDQGTTKVVISQLFYDTYLKKLCLKIGNNYSFLNIPPVTSGLIFEDIVLIRAADTLYFLDTLGTIKMQFRVDSAHNMCNILRNRTPLTSAPYYFDSLNISDYCGQLQNN